MSKSRLSAQKVLLSSRGQIDKLDAGLCSVSGAKEVIALLEERKAVTKLVLSHNDLRNEGCTMLFQYLCSVRGRRHPIKEISLSANAIGDRGLSAIADYLVDNEHLKELSLQNNVLQGESETVSGFIRALQSSRVEVLLLGNNQALSDPFLHFFLTHLDAPHLKQLDVSIIGLSSASTPRIISFLTSPRSRRLEAFKCNANNLGFKSVRSIVDAVSRNNFNLFKLELHGNCVDPRPNPPIEQGEDVDSLSNQKVNERRLKTTLMRNELLKETTARASIALLKYARALLLVPKRHHLNSDSPTSRALVLHPHATSLNNEDIPPLPFPFTSLPVELQLHIFGFLAPPLSTPQLVRIFNYAAASDTLPRLEPRLPNRCLPDPSALPFGLMPHRGCGGGYCMGAENSVSCHRIKEQKTWLAEVGCDRFELDESGANKHALGML